MPPVPQTYAPVVSPGAGPSIPSMGPTPVYHYVNPTTQEHVASLLPPNHPQMVCLQEGRHDRETRYGVLGAFYLLKLCGCEGCLRRLQKYFRCPCGRILVPAGNWSLLVGPPHQVSALWSRH